MVYKQNFVVAVKHNGKVLRDVDSAVEIPFGEEYSILLKNLNTQRALVSVYIDGENVLNRSEIVIEPKRECELEGYLNGNKVEHRFKFVEKRGRVLEHRRNNLEDGIIRVEYKFEEPVYIPIWIKDYTFPPIYTSGEGQTCLYFSNTEQNWSNEAVCCSENSDNGMTVRGSEGQQEFNEVSVGNNFSSIYCITIKLKGRVKKKRITAPFYTSTKLRCDKCDCSITYGTNYCPDCGNNVTHYRGR